MKDTYNAEKVTFYSFLESDRIQIMDPRQHNLDYFERMLRCPSCGSKNGELGTSFAYFICYDCKREQYWTPDNKHPDDWAEAIGTSPFGRASELLDMFRRYKEKG